MSVWLPHHRFDQPDPDLATGKIQPVLFLDRDGVVIKDEHYLHDPELVSLLPGSVEGMRLARESGFSLVGLSNQSGIGRGFFTEVEFALVQQRMDDLLAREGVKFDAFLYCPHAPEAKCQCRKPAMGLLEEAARLVPWDQSRSWLVGDKLTDLELAARAGIGGVLVRTGYGSEQESSAPEGTLIADDLLEAVRSIILGAGN